MFLYPDKWPCDFFPVLRTILSGNSAWKVNNSDIIYLYLKHHLWFEMKWAWTHYEKVKK